MPEFRAEIELAGKTATGIEVPPAVVEQLGRGKRPAVTVTFNGYSYRSTIASMKGRFLIPVSAAVREAAGASAGDVVAVVVELDDAPRTIEVPPDLAAGLAGDATAKAFYEGLSFSHQRAYVDWITGAKKDETRERRVTQAVEMLRAGTTR